jgi:Transposase DDE domain
VHATLDDLVIALYCVVDELLGPDPRRHHPGRKPRLSDAELVCLATAQVLLGCHSEHRWLRFCYGRLGHLFPYLPNQPGYNKRLRQARWLLQLVTAHLAGHTPAADDPLRLLDATPVPCAASRTTVTRSALRGLADYGWCPSHSRWYWGLKLYVLCTPDGSPVTWCLASPRLGEREVAMALLDRASLRPGQVLVVDKGLAGAEMDRHVADLQAVLVRPDRRDEPARYGSLRPVRQWIESIIDTLKGQLGLEQHGGRSLAGVHTRVGQRLLALAAAVWFNSQLGAEDTRSLVAYDH